MHLTATLALALASTASAHTWMSSVTVNGVDQGDGRRVYIRSPPNNSPIKDLSSPEIVCGSAGAKAVPSFVKAQGGDRIEFKWFHNKPGDSVIDLSHKGPVITYIAPYTSGPGTGPIWSKIAEDGFSNGKWAVERLVANGGRAAFQLPAGLAPGQYLVRQEIIAHHESDGRFDQNPSRGAQFYPSCVQFEIGGSGSVVPDQNFDFNTGYKYSDKGIHFDLYTSFSSYTIPGPPVFSGSGGGAAPAPVVPGPTSPSLTATPTSRAGAYPTGAPVGGQPTTLLTSVRRVTYTKTVTVNPTGSCDSKNRGRN